MKKGWYEVVNPPDLSILLLIPGIRQEELISKDGVTDYRRIKPRMAAQKKTDSFF